MQQRQDVCEYGTEASNEDPNNVKSREPRKAANVVRCRATFDKNGKSTFSALHIECTCEIRSSPLFATPEGLLTTL